jgi:hypothetical protein
MPASWTPFFLALIVGLPLGTVSVSKVGERGQPAVTPHQASSHATLHAGLLGERDASLSAIVETDTDEDDRDDGEGDALAPFQTLRPNLLAGNAALGQRLRERGHAPLAPRSPILRC